MVPDSIGAWRMATGSSSEVFPDERQRIILARLARDGRVLAAELAREFRTSEDTIRRDLRDLAGAGQCRRVYGGALPLSPAFGSWADRRAEATERKAALGSACAALVRPRLRAGAVLFLDAGSTNLAIARALPLDRDVTVVTNAPEIAAALTGQRGIELVVIGGRIDPRSGAAVGARALRDLRELRADLAILGACAVSAEAGIAAFGAEEAEFKRAVAARSASVAAAVLNDRLGTIAPFAIGPASTIAHLVVEADAPESEVASLAGIGVEICRAKPAATDIR